MKTNSNFSKIFIMSFLFGIVFLLAASSSIAQNNWIVPEEDNKKISFLSFDDDLITEGRILYENSCTSCHGNPGQADFTLMVPSPGDPAGENFQNQTDGSILYKIREGRGSMPSFREAFSEDEIWNLVAFIRSFNSNYEQPLPDLTGIEVPELSLALSFDENVDKLVVKVTDSGNAAQEVSVSASIKTMFGKFSLGEHLTNNVGIAYFDVDARLPGDSLGNLTTTVKAKKGYGFVKTTETIKMATPTIKKSAILPRQLWSTDDEAPLWLDAIFHFTVIAFWCVMIAVVFQLRKLKNVK